MNDILKKYKCIVPFTYLEIQKENCYGCCPSWLPSIYGKTNDLISAWNGETANKVRESILDGTYKYCDKNICPHLSQLINTGVATNIFKSDIQKINGPTRLNLSFDRSCNISCPSCRKDIIMANADELKEIKTIINNISNNFGDSVTYLYISGTSDPFASKTFRDFLINFDSNLFPKLKEIHIHTNGLLLNEEMWLKLEKVHKYIKTLEVSIDAATKETYEIVRRGGNWEKLIENINFISSIPTIIKKDFSFVVQDTNYKEMSLFYELISNLPFNPKNKFNVFFSKILNNGTYTEDEYLTKQIWNELHPRFNDFLIELQKVGLRYNSINNMNDIIEKYNLKSKRKFLI